MPGVTDAPYVTEVDTHMLAVRVWHVCVSKNKRVAELYLAGLVCSLCKDHG